MFTITAVVTLVAAGVAIAWLGLDPLLASTVGAANGPVVVSAIILAVCATLLWCGGYVWLDRFIKVVMPILSICTMWAMITQWPNIDWSWGALIPSGAVFDVAGIAFCVALIGWMPSAIDISVWSSLWTLARADHSGTKPEPRNVLLDFDVGYLATLLLALAFVLLGTGLMHGQGLTFENSASKFAAQVIDLYTTSLGGWARPVIGTAAFLVMLSTAATVVDAFPRVLAALVVQLRFAFSPQSTTDVSVPSEGDRRIYRASFAVLCAGALAILVWGMSSFTALVDLATTLSFLTAPVLSYFNHRAIHAPEVSRHLQPGAAMTAWSWVAIILQAAFAAYFLWLKLGPGAV
jgi:Mn2+/Fe2+ NRAMP family transporter